jgi:ElaB/YqjD/DUF883 family membrane-anchored ribosome-binding protein
MSMYGIREGSSAGEWVMNTVSRNPEGLLLLAAGAALLMRSGLGQKARYAPSSMSRQYSGSRETSETGSGVGERLRESAERAGEYVSEATDRVAGTARSYASSAMEYADEATQTAMDRSRRMAGQAQETADYVVQEQPWAVALGGVIAGAVVAAIFPATRLERRTLGEAGQRMRSAAGRMGEQLMEAGMQAGERLSEVAEERGLTAEGLKDAARDVGETFSSALSGEEARSGQGTNRQRSGERSASSTQNRPAPGARTDQNAHSQEAGRAQSPQPGSSKAGGSGRPGGASPSGGRK